MDEVPSAGRTSIPDTNGRLDSWKEIAAYLNRGVRTVIRWEQEEGLPVHRLQHDKRGSVFAHKAELDAWLKSRSGLVADRDDRPHPAWGVPARWRSVSATGLVVLLLAAFGLRLLLKWGAEPRARVTPLTTYNGVEVTPALSPDGRLVAFSWNGPAEDNRDIYVLLIGSGAPLRLTSDSTIEASPAWSPDGKEIAFVRINQDLSFGIHVVPALGGAERHLGAVRRTPSNFPLRITWTPDGRWIVVPHLTDEWCSALYLVPVEGGEMRQLTFPRTGMHDVSGTVSPDGRMLAFLRSSDSNTWRVHVVALDGNCRVAGEARAIGPTRYSMLQPAWAGDSGSVYYLSEDKGILSMWTESVASSGEARLVSAGWPAGWTEATVSPATGRAVLSDAWNDLDLYRFDLTGSARPVRIASSTASDINPQYSPDGRRIAFSSRRSGTFQIYVVDEDGRNERQLTSLASTVTGMPRWSPDGARIAFDARVDGREGVWVVDAGGGPPRRLTQLPVTGFNPSWSRDGKSIYFCSRLSGRAEIWKMPFAPGSAGTHPVQLTKTEGWSGFESLDGRFFYYARAYQNGPVMRIPTTGGEPVEIVPRLNLLHNLAVVQDGLYYALSDEAHFNQSVWFHSFASGKSKKVLDTGRRAGIGLAVSPDHHSLICTLMESRGGDLWLVEGWRP